MMTMLMPGVSTDLIEPKEGWAVREVEIDGTKMQVHCPNDLTDNEAAKRMEKAYRYTSMLLEDFDPPVVKV